jgi:DNA-binding NtrC family response regulator
MVAFLSTKGAPYTGDRKELARAEADRAGRKRPGERPSRGGSRRALVVEDNDQVRRIAVALLTRLDFRVVSVSSALGARETFEPAGFTLLFTDVILPDGNGYELASEFAEGDPALKILLTSGYTGARHRVTPGTRARWPLLAKPYRFNQLEAAVEALMV